MFNFYLQRQKSNEMTITAQDVNKLRQMTGAGMMDCKKALVESEGDFEKAIEILRKTGQKVSASRADRSTTEGSVFIKNNESFTEGIMIALGCETDFVAKNEEFLALGELISQSVFLNKPNSLEELNAIEVEGQSINDRIVELIGKIGEKIEIVDYSVITGERIIPYIHAGNKLGVMVSLKGTNGTDVEQAGMDVAMQIAAMNPLAVNKEQVDAATVEMELNIGREQALAEGKPENIVDKIAEGKLNKFFKDNTLLNQSFVKDSSLTVEKYLQTINQSLTVDTFKRVSIGA